MAAVKALGRYAVEEFFCGCHFGSKNMSKWYFLSGSLLEDVFGFPCRMLLQLAASEMLSLSRKSNLETQQKNRNKPKAFTVYLFLE